jgi:tetratricopeptide (TPR) repeat protein
MRGKVHAIALAAVLCVIGSAHAVAAGVPWDTLAQRGIGYVYNLQFEQAESAFREMVAERPRDPAGHFFLAMVDWWKIVIDIENTRNDEPFFTKLDAVIDLCDSLIDANPSDLNAIFFKGGAIGFKGRLKFHRDDYLAAANAGRQALPLVQEAAELDPNNYDILLGTGMYNYYADVIPAEYPMVKPLLLFVPSGDRAKGLRQLNLAAEHGKYSSVETLYFLMQIYFFYEKDVPKALTISQRLMARFPDNPVFHRYLGRCCSVLGQWKDSDAAFREILARAQGGKRGYGKSSEREAEYYIGLAQMGMKNNAEALKHFYRCDELSRVLDVHEQSGFMAMANLKVGVIFDMEGKRDQAIAQYRKVLDLKEYKDSHEQAERFLKAPAN